MNAKKDLEAEGVTNVKRTSMEIPRLNALSVTATLKDPCHSSVTTLQANVSVLKVPNASVDYD